jgi:SWI/SNF-related matrix-associated actin-dependent regulator of chromatin subfamily A-like protein 1
MVLDYARALRATEAQRFYHKLVAERGMDDYEFQARGVAWLAERHTAYLADEGGGGKSPQAIIAADFLDIPHIEVICPAIAVTDWTRKFETWSSRARAIYPSYNSAPVPPAGVRANSVIISGYETTVNHRKLLQANPHRGLLIIDEAHYIKNPTTIRARAIYGADCAADPTKSKSISAHYDRVWLLSGTPLPNGDPREMWPHLRALRPYSILNGDGRPMTRSEWEYEFCIFRPGLGDDKVVGIRTPERFRRIISDFVLQRTSVDMGLPDVRFELYPMEAKKVPRALAIEAWPDLADALRAILTQAEAGDIDEQLKAQMATVRRLTGLLKVEAITSLVTEELRAGTVDKILVFGYHVDVVNEIAKRLSPFGAAAITGATSEKTRWSVIDDFNAGRRRVLVGEILAAGTNVGAPCRNVIFAETDWVPDNNRQAAWRARRIDGHREPVLARMLTIDGTIDDLMQQAARRKLSQTRQLLFS